MPPDGSTEGSEDETFDILSARVQVSGRVARFELSRTTVWVLDGYWYPRLTHLREARLNSNFVFGTGWWAENGA